jgi:hypothetical protein
VRTHILAGNPEDIGPARGLGGKGGQVAAPIARKILNAIFMEKVASVDLDG